MKKILIQIQIFIESILVFKEVLAGKRKSSVNHLTRLQSFKLFLPHKLYFVLAYWHDSLGNKMKKRHCWCCSYIYWLLYSLKIIAVKVLTDICQEGSKDPRLTGFKHNWVWKGNILNFMCISFLLTHFIQQHEDASGDACPPAHYGVMSSFWILSPFAANS